MIAPSAKAQQYIELICSRRVSLLPVYDPRPILQTVAIQITFNLKAYLVFSVQGDFQERINTRGNPLEQLQRTNNLRQPEPIERDGAYA